MPLKKQTEVILLRYTRETLSLIALCGSLYLGATNPELYAETAKIVLVSTLSGYFGLSNPLKGNGNPPGNDKPKTPSKRI